MSNLLIDLSKDHAQGGFCNVHEIVGHKDIVFKEFGNKKTAIESYKYQKLLTRFDLAPKIYSKICKLDYAPYGFYSIDEPSSWGYVTEKALPVNHTKKTMVLLQELVENIAIKTKLKFWDCHWYNIGFLKRGRSKKLVCIDTGKESFSGYSNAWGGSTPGPKCGYCNYYQCKCSTEPDCNYGI
jgi:hypothetical protein